MEFIICLIVAIILMGIPLVLLNAACTENLDDLGTSKWGK